MEAAVLSLAVIVLGLSGRLGRRIDLGDRARLIGVSRGGAGLRCDVIDAASRRRCASDALAAAEGSSTIVVIDALLDRRTVGSMRASINGSTSLALEILEAAADAGRAGGAVVCATTAVLSPALLTTPYARFKRAQVEAYARSGKPLAVLLLPRLVSDDRARPAGFVLCFEDGAAVAVAEAESMTRVTRRLLVPVRGGRAPLITASRRRGDGLRAAAAAGPFAVRRWTVDRDVPVAHRRASHSLLAALPDAVRARVDHHVAPGRRVVRLARALSLDVVTM